MADPIKDEPGFKTVPLSRRYSAFDKTFDSVRLREPTYKDIYMSGLGAPTEFQPNGQGGYVIITNYKVIAEYIDKIAVDPPSECLHALSALDSEELEKAVISFFRRPKASTSTPTG